MTDKVVSLKGGPVENERRQLFVQTVAAAFDTYVERYNCEPEAIVYVLCGLKGASQLGWDIQGESRGGVASVLSLAAVHCLTEAGSTYKSEIAS